MRITFVNTGRNPFELEPCFFGGDGARVKEGAGVTLAPGQTRSLELGWSEAAGRAGGRIELRGAAHLNKKDEKHLVMAGELVEEADGQSSLLWSDAPFQNIGVWYPSPSPFAHPVSPHLVVGAENRRRFPLSRPVTVIMVCGGPKSRANATWSAPPV